MPMSTNRVCLQDLVPSSANLRVQPLQLQEVEPSRYCKVSYWTEGFESEGKVQTLRMVLIQNPPVAPLSVPVHHCRIFHRHHSAGFGTGKNDHYRHCI